VALTVAAPLASRLCTDLTVAEHKRLNGVVYQGIVCASLLLDRPLSPNYLTYITDADVPFTAVVEMTSLVDPAPLGGQALVYLPRYVTADDPAWGWSDDEVEDRFTAALSRIYPVFADREVRAFRVSRVRQVLALATLGYSSRLPGFDTSVPGVHLVTSAQIVNGTLNVDETVQLAERAATHLLTARRSEPVRGAVP
jgi:protoporphyrinogen oxidase